MDLYFFLGNAQHRCGSFASGNALQTALSISAELHAQKHMPLARHGARVDDADRASAPPRRRERASTVACNAGDVRLALGAIAGSTGPRRSVVAFVGAIQ